ncbi:MAG TPA: hypothetical protein PLZ53_10440 [Candidatus Hydrogenedentes bacterium]|jgi:uncharacterized protein YbaR (Trm112 family)|nr:MAG: hypothetical protein BWY07_01879 [Candidatus Hydrogenedentes bacterium ADurb.Bin170]HNZ48729.1 hypothetical protein [Candidatus Hydrogenedentota bacterium]HOD95228.1 hypothetical protein [Candidatus Hydrogenedentota bacterium]HOH43525.1 hypothetical protein [Candidatus Hydrogenedentota bacterium]HOM47909.1 hypothetical protein [Candidatus Hydrogenedentota bacterium]
MVNPELLKILVCPENKTPLHPAAPEVLDALNAEVVAGTLKNRAGDTVTDLIQEGLIREDGAVLYIVRDDIPVMLIEEAVPLAKDGSDC